MHLSPQSFFHSQQTVFSGPSMSIKSVVFRESETDIPPQLSSKPAEDSMAYSNLFLIRCWSQNSGSLSRFMQVEAVGRRSRSFPPLCMQKAGYSSWKHGWRWGGRTVSNQRFRGPQRPCIHYIHTTDVPLIWHNTSDTTVVFLAKIINCKRHQDRNVISREKSVDIQLKWAVMFEGDRV